MCSTRDWGVPGPDAGTTRLPSRETFDLCDAHGAVGCRLFELNYAGPQSGLLCAVMEYSSMKEYGQAGDAWMADDAARRLIGTMHGDSPFEPVSSGLFTEVDVF